MADRSVIISSSVAPGATVNTDSAPLAAGRKLQVRRFGAADVSAAGVSLYRLLFGVVGSFQLIRMIAVSRGTVQLDVDKHVVGDGVKFFRLQQQNPDAAAKEMPVWVDAFDA